MHPSAQYGHVSQIPVGLWQHPFLAYKDLEQLSQSLGAPAQGLMQHPAARQEGFNLHALYNTFVDVAHSVLLHVQQVVAWHRASELEHGEEPHKEQVNELQEQPTSIYGLKTFEVPVSAALHCLHCSTVEIIGIVSQGLTQQEAFVQFTFVIQLSY